MNNDFSAAAIRATALSNLTDEKLEFNVITVGEIIRSELADTEPEVIYTADAFEVCQDHQLMELLHDSDIEERLNEFKGCSNTAQCAEREANVIVSLYYEMAVSGLADEIAELMGNMIDVCACDEEFTVSRNWNVLEVIETGCLDDGATEYEIGVAGNTAYGRIMYPSTEGERPYATIFANISGE